MVFRQPELLESKVLHLLRSPELLQEMAQKSGTFAVTDSAKRLATLVSELKNK